MLRTWFTGSLEVKIDSKNIGKNTQKMKSNILSFHDSSILILMLNVKKENVRKSGIHVELKKKFINYIIISYISDVQNQQSLESKNYF